MKSATSILTALALALGVSASAYQGLRAKVGSDIITAWDVEENVVVLSAGMSDAERQSKEGQARLAEARQTVLERMIEEKLVGLAAKKGPEGFEEAAESGRVLKNPYLPADTEIDQQVEKAFEETRSRFGTQKAFEEELERERISTRELRQRLRDRIRDRLTYDKMIGIKQAEFRQQVRVSDDEAREFFEKNRGQFAVADQVRLRHILVGERDGKLASDIKRRLDAGESFADLARRYSIDSVTREKGGRLEWVEKGQLRWPQLEKAAFAAETGKAAGPVKTGEGWHVLRVDDRKSGFEQDFENVKPKIKNMIYSEKINNRVLDWLKGLRDEYYVEILE